MTGRMSTMTLDPTSSAAARAAAAPLALALTGKAMAADPAEIVTVVKIGGIPWFNAMEVGIQKEGKELGVNASMIGPTQADAAQQVRAVEDLIARKVDVIAVVPNDAVALEPVFKRAQEAGIKVLTHESPDQKFNDWNVELTSAQGFGEQHMEALAKAMGGKGKYIVYVGSLTVPLHNKWADAAIALAEGEVSRTWSWSPTASASPRAWTTATRRRSTRCAPTRTSRAFWRSAARARSAPRVRSRSAARSRASPWSGRSRRARAPSTSSPAPSAKATSGTRCWPAR